MSRIALDTTPRRLLWAALCALIAMLYLVGARREYRAATLATLADRQSLERAAQLQPGNAEYFFRLGRFDFYAQDIAGAQRNLAKAAQLNPYEARYWLQLAAVHHIEGNVEAERAAIGRALKDDPKSPQVAWEAANLALVAGEREQALLHLRTVVENSPDMGAAVFDLAWRATGHDTGQLLDKVVPPIPAGRFAFIDFLTAHNEAGAAALTWERIRRTRSAFAPQLAFPYMDYLLARQPDAAVDVWEYLKANSPPLAPAVEAGNAVFNSGFEQNLLGGGFDWQVTRSGETVGEIDSEQFHSGQRSVALTFLGPAVADSGVSQYVPVQPNTSYVLSAWVKNENIQSANGPRLVVDQVTDGRQLGASDEVLGSDTWRRMEIEFRTTDTRLVKVKVTRRPSEGLIKGKIWFDDLQLAAK